MTEALQSSIIQVIAAGIGSIGFGIFFITIDSIGGMLGNDIVSKICGYLAFTGHNQDFTAGLLNVVDIVFFLSISVLFIFLTIRVLDKKRYK